MAYNMTEWQTGDVVTEEKINNMELGIFNNNSLKASGFVFDYNDAALEVGGAVGTVEEFREALSYGSAMTIRRVVDDDELFMSVSSYSIYFENDTITDSSELYVGDATFTFKSYSDGLLKFNTPSE